MLLAAGTLRADITGPITGTNSAPIPSGTVLCNSTGGAAAPSACATLPTGLTIPTPLITGAVESFNGGTWGVGQFASALAPVYGSFNIAGTNTAGLNASALGQYWRIVDTGTTFSGGGALAGFYMVTILNSTAITGQREGAQISLNINSATANTPQLYTALGTQCQMAATDATTGSDCYAINGVSNVNAGVTVRNFVGAEFDVHGAGGGAAISGYRGGLNVVDTSASNNDLQSATAMDFGIGLAYSSFNANTAGAGHGFLNGLQMGGTSTYFPVSTSGTMIYACNNFTANSSCNFTVNKGIDWSAGTFTTFQYSGPGFLIDGSGHLLNSTPGGNIYLGADTAAAYDGIVVIPGATVGNTVEITPSGSGSNIDLHLQSKGTSNVYIQNGAGGIAGLFSSGGASNISGDYVLIGGNSAGNNFASVTAAGSDTNVDLRLISKGTRSVLAAPGTDGVAFKVQNAAFTNTYLSVNTSTNAIALGLAGTSVTMPGLASSSAATTGTLCWTTVTGNVNVDTTLACLSSTKRIKQHIQPLDAGLAEVMKLRPVSYDLKPEYNPKGLGPMVGLVAEEVQKIDPRLVGLDANGDPQGVRYMQMTAVLVKALQEEQAEITELRREIKRMHAGGTRR